MANIKKEKRRKHAAARLTAQLKEGIKRNWIRLISGKIKETEELLTDKDIARIKQELVLIEAYNSGKKKVKKTKEGKVVEEKQRWFIDILSVAYGYVKRTERKKNKGKSRKKLKRIKSITFLKTVVAQEGMITAYREGRMGISPKTHTFRLRKDEPSQY